MKKLGNIINSVLLAAIMALLGAAVQTWIDVHDLKHTVVEQKAKLDWLYHYTFPTMAP